MTGTYCGNVLREYISLGSNPFFYRLHIQTDETGTFEENGITVDSVGCAARLVVRLDAIIGAI